MTNVTVPVPDDRVADFYRFFGSWLEGDLEEALAVTRQTAEKAWNRDGAPWGQTDEDLEKAEWLWKKFTPRAREVFGLFLDNPGKEYTGEEVAERFGIKNGVRGVAGTLAWPGRYCIQTGRELPSDYRVDPDTDEGLYRMSEENAELFKTARANIERTA